MDSQTSDTQYFGFTDSQAISSSHDQRLASVPDVEAAHLEKNHPTSDHLDHVRFDLTVDRSDIADTDCPDSLRSFQFVLAELNQARERVRALEDEMVQICTEMHLVCSHVFCECTNSRISPAPWCIDRKKYLPGQ